MCTCNLGPHMLSVCRGALCTIGVHGACVEWPENCSNIMMSLNWCLAGTYRDRNCFLLQHMTVTSNKLGTCWKQEMRSQFSKKIINQVVTSENWKRSTCLNIQQCTLFEEYHKKKEENNWVLCMRRISSSSSLLPCLWEKMLVMNDEEYMGVVCITYKKHFEVNHFVV
jgi:hypothetical protein